MPLNWGDFVLKDFIGLNFLNEMLGIRNPSNRLVVDDRFLNIRGDKL